MMRHEKGQGKGLVCADKNRIELSGGEKNLKQQVFSCSHVFGPECSQEDVFKNSGVQALLNASLRGFQSTLFGYGPTGCGKTHTVLGDTTTASVTTVGKDGAGTGGQGSSSSSSMDCDGEGLVPRSIRDMFRQVEQLSNEGGREVKLRVSALEIYREVIRDHATITTVYL